MSANRKYLQFSHDSNTPWFDDGPLVKRVVRIDDQNVNGIDTSAIDAYRQGVEITTMSHFDAGMGKISAGEPGHLLRQSSFGGARSRRQIEELKNYVPISSTHVWSPLDLSPAAWWRADIGVVEADFWRDLVNVTANGNSLTKMTVGYAWNAGAATGRMLVGNGYVEFSAPENTTEKMAGLSFGNTDVSPNDIDFAIYLRSDGVVGIFEAGVSIAYPDNYVANDVFRIQVAGDVVTYYRNGNLLYTSLATATHPLLFDAIIATDGGKINNVTFSGAIPNITEWQDQSGHGHHLQMLAGDQNRQPGYDSSGTLEKIVLMRSNVSRMQEAIASIDWTLGHTVILIGKYNGGAHVANWQTWFLAGVTAAVDRYIWIGRDANLIYGIDITNSFLSRAYLSGDFCFDYEVYDSAPQDILRMRINGGAWATGNTTIPAGPGLSKCAIGAINGSGGSEGADLDIYEIFVAAPQLSSTNLALMRAYCLERYGV